MLGHTKRPYLGGFLMKWFLCLDVYNRLKSSSSVSRVILPAKSPIELAVIITLVEPGVVPANLRFSNSLIALPVLVEFLPVVILLAALCNESDSSFRSLEINSIGIDPELTLEPINLSYNTSF